MHAGGGGGGEAGGAAAGGGAEQQQGPLHRQQQQHQPQHAVVDEGGGGASGNNGTMSIVRNIASFLTLSDVASVASADSWMVGGSAGEFGEYDHDLHEFSWSVSTPPTPGVVAISPGATPAASAFSGCYSIDRGDRLAVDGDHDVPVEDAAVGGGDEEDNDSVVRLERALRDRKRKWAQEKLTAAIFSHPQPLRSFVLDAYAKAQEIREEHDKQQRKADWEDDPETTIEPRSTKRPKLRQQHRRRGGKKFDVRLMFLHDMVDFLFHNVPLSVMFDVVDVLVGISLDTSFASIRLTVMSINGAVSAMGYAACVVWDAITNFNPFQLLEAIISLQFNAMGRTSEAIASGIQSVATGVGSASSLALHRLSAANLSISVNYPGSSQTGGGEGSARHRGHRGTMALNSSLNKKLLKKMSSLNDAARVVSYRESGDETGGLSHHAISRTRRMMHYSVSLRPFVATVAVKGNTTPTRLGTDGAGEGGCIGSEAITTGSGAFSALAAGGSDNGDGSTYASISPDDDNSSPFICSPQSFPPTPRSRHMVLARGSQFADDVVFLARDRLRVHDGLESGDDRTREMAWALREGKRLAIFDGNGMNGIELTCGQHIATKVGSMHYASTRSMVPVLRNVYVYFEISVMPRMHNDLAVQAAPPVTLSVGLSTSELPLNTLVGAWQGSVGLCTTGQIFVAGQWLGFADPSMSAYGPNATVGCLVFLDDGSAFETWDGVMVNASVTFNINGVLVPPPVSSLPMPGGAERSPGSQVNNTSTPQPPSGEGTGARYTMPTLLVPASEELYPTVTLQTPATAVMCRFSSEDVICRSSIGAPEGATVYAVDGSVIFSPEDT